MATIKLGTVPGVYIQEEVNPDLAITEQRLKTAGLIGHAQPTVDMKDVAIVRGEDTDIDALPEGYETGVVIHSVSDYLNAKGTNLPKYNQYPTEEPVVPTYEEEVAPTTPSFVEVPELPAEPTAEEQAAYDDAVATNAALQEQYDAELIEYNAVVIRNAELRNAYNAKKALYDNAVEDADYKLTADGKIEWLSNNRPTEGASYYVSFTADRPSSSYAPLLWDSIESIVAYYGPSCYHDANGKLVINEVTTAARLLFSNGANIVCIRAVPTGASSADAITKSLEELADLELQTVLVIPQGQDEDAAVRKGKAESIHREIATRMVTDSATENGRERVSWIAGVYDDNGAVVDDASTIASYAKSFKEQRITLVAPSQVTLLLEDEEGVSQEVKASSIYAAAALTGMTTDNTRTVAEPLTRETPAGIYGLSKLYKRSDVEKMSAAGVTVLVNRNNAVSVNQAVTTDTTNQNNRELSVVLIKDEVMKTIRYNLDREYIGHFYDRNKTPTKIKTSIMLMLDEMTGTLVQDYDESNIVVTPDSKDSTRVNVNMKFAVLRPLNYIYISFMVTL